VVWTNVGTASHTASDPTGMGLFDTGALPVGWSGWTTFVAAGRYPVAVDGITRGKVAVPVGTSRVNGGTKTEFTITWASAVAPGGYAYDVQLRRPGGSWKTWRDGISWRSAVFRPDAGAGTYRFRARLVLLADGSHPAWSAARAIHVG
jgi:hypothetical protein